MKPLINGKEFPFARVRVMTTRGLRAVLAEDVTVNARTQQGVLFVPATESERRQTQTELRSVQSPFELVLTFGEGRQTAREQRLIGCHLLSRESPNLFFTFASLVETSVSPA